MPLGPYGGPRGWAFSYERGTHVGRIATGRLEHAHDREKPHTPVQAQRLLLQESATVHWSAQGVVCSHSLLFLLHYSRPRVE